ncbi:MAG: hypothetical protein H7222_11010 [Methylotenera sp.]|nr:hypothetical protein [Oligoflexia bacterium]
MANFKDVLPSQQGWIHELARAEIHPDAERLLQLGRNFDPQQLVEESTIDFLMELREHFNDFARIFNAYSENSARFQEVKVYSVAQTAADFMVFRNQVKLVITNSAHGVIQLSFAQHTRGNLASDALEGRQGNQDLLAQVGPFRDIYWTYQGEKVRPEQVAKFYFSEFTRATREARASKGNNQLLLDQIKALLQEKGLDL